jgi:hypothetical protein
MSVEHLLIDAIVWTLAVLGLVVAWRSEKKS